jgi:hypothetical protein
MADARRRVGYRTEFFERLMKACDGANQAAQVLAGAEWALARTYPLPAPVIEDVRFFAIMGFVFYFVLDGDDVLLIDLKPITSAAN